MGRLEILTNSSMGTLRRCDERFRLQYLERLVPPGDRPPLSTGSAVHKGIELGDPLAARKALEAEVWPGDRTERFADRQSACEAMVAGALLRWPDWPELQEWKFETPLRNPMTGHPSTRHKLGGKADGVWEASDDGWQTTERTLLEIKTTSRLDGDFIKRKRIESQPTMYMEAASIFFGEPVRRAIYRIIRKPGIRRHKGETQAEYEQRCADRKPLAPLKQRKSESDFEYETRSQAREDARKPLTKKEPETDAAFHERLMAIYTDPDNAEKYFAEVEVTRTEEQMERWRYEVWEQHQRVMRLEGGGMSLRNDQSCLDYGRCDYFDLCTGEVGVKAFRVSDVAHPELED